MLTVTELHLVPFITQLLSECGEEAEAEGWFRKGDAA
jgi:hypothetical protein